MRVAVCTPCKLEGSSHTWSQNTDSNRVRIENQVLGHAAVQDNVQLGSECATAISSYYNESVSASYVVRIHADFRPADLSE